MPSKRRSGLSSSALASGLDTVIPDPAAEAAAAREQPRPVAGDTTGTTTKEKIAGYVPADLADSVRDAVAALGSHADDPRSLSEFLENAARNELARLQRERNGGDTFPRRARRALVAGRRAE